MIISRIFPIFICFAVFLLGGCSSGPSKPSEIETWVAQNGKPKVLSTTAMIDDLVGQIGKDRIDHIALIMGEIDPHSYELVKGDDEKLHLATLIFYNGLGLEHGASLRYQLDHHRNAIGLGDKLLEREPHLILHAGREIDPHIWMDISLWSRMIGPIVEALSQADPEGREFYQTNGEVLQKIMSQAHQSIYGQIQKVPSAKRLLVTSHDAFNYFARAYLAAPDETTQEQWQKRCEAPEGLAPDGQLSASDIQEIIHHLIQYRVQVVFPESNVSRDSLKKIVHACRQKGLEVKIADKALYADAMGSKDSNAGTYLQMVMHDANILIEAWK